MGLEARVTELETRVAFQETTIQELNEILIDKQTRLDKLYHLLDELRLRLDDLASGKPQDPANEPPPPHY